MSEFPEVQQLYLDETVRMHGLGYSCTTQLCALCQEPVGLLAPLGSGRRRFFRCQECGVFHQCLDCCLKHHVHTPLHRVEVSPSLCGCGRRTDLTAGVERRLLALQKFEVAGYGVPSGSRRLPLQISRPRCALFDGYRHQRHPSNSLQILSLPSVRYSKQSCPAASKCLVSCDEDRS